VTIKPQGTEFSPSNVHCPLKSSKSLLSGLAEDNNHVNHSYLLFLVVVQKKERGRGEYTAAQYSGPAHDAFLSSETAPTTHPNRQSLRLRQIQPAMPSICIALCLLYITVHLNSHSEFGLLLRPLLQKRTRFVAVPDEIVG